MRNETKLEVTVVAESLDREQKWITDIERTIGRSSQVVFRPSRETSAYGNVVLIDQLMPELYETIDRIDRAGRALVLLVSESATIPHVFIEGKVDDVLVHPFRPIEVLTKLKNFEQALLFHQVNEISQSLGELTERMREDLEVATRLQKRRLPARFPEQRGIKIAYRYFAGFKAGGDHFDLADSRDGSRLSVFVSDSSSYGLSSAVLGALMRLTLKLSSEEARSSSETVKRIYEELQASMSEKDALSLFYGVINRKTWALSFVTLGDCFAFRAPEGQAFEKLAVSGGAIRQGVSLDALAERTLQLAPGDRLAIVSDGFIETVGGEANLVAILEKYRRQDANDTLNELAFRVKSKFAEPDDLPDQDCTAFVFDIDSKLLRLQS